MGRCVIQHRLVAADSREVVHIAGIGEPHHRVDQQVPLDLGGGVPGQLHVGPVHRIPGLERDHSIPTETLELVPELGRRVP